MAWYDFIAEGFEKNPKDWLNVGANIGSAIIASNAAKDASAASTAAGERAAAAAEFKPYAITTGLGTSFFDKEKQQAGYDLDPRLAAFRDTLYQGSGNFLGQVQEDPVAAAQRYFQTQQDIMAPQRLAEDVALKAQLAQQGRIGLGLSPAAVGGGNVSGGYLQPEEFKLGLQRAIADQQLAGTSYQMGQADIDRAISRGTGLMQAGLGVEQLGLTPLTIGADIGSKQATSGAQVGANLLAGAGQATQANLAGSLGAANLLGNMFKAAQGYKDKA